MIRNDNIDLADTMDLDQIVCTRVHRVRRVIEFDSIPDMVQFLWNQGEVLHNLQNTYTDGNSETRKDNEISFTIAIDNWLNILDHYHMEDLGSRLHKCWKCTGLVK